MMIDLFYRFMIFIIALGIAMDFNALYLFFSICYVCIVKKEKEICFELSVWIYLVLVLIYIFGFLLNTSYLTLDDPVLSICKYALQLLIVFFMFTLRPDGDLIIFSKAFSISLIFKCFIIISFSYYLSETTNDYYGYGRLFNPIQGIDVVSPKVALALCVALSLYTLILNDRFLINILLVSISFFMFNFIQSRTSIVISSFLLVYLIFKSYRTISFNRKITFLMFLSIIILLLMLYYGYIQSDQLNDSVSDNRLMESGLQSKRYLHWADGVQKLIYNPFGGFSIDERIEYIHHFHNLFIDSARIYGWVAFLLVLYLIVSGFYFIMKKKRLFSDFINYVISYFVVVLIMMQDVIIEGNFQVFISWVLIVLLATKIKTRNT